MLLRPRQQVFVERCVAALDKHGNTAGVAPTGSGKTIMLSAVAGKYLHRGIGKALILQHRDELLTQNCSKMMRVVPDARPTIYNAERKDWRGNVVFASEPTLRRVENLHGMPKFDLAVVDECFPAGTLIDGRPIETVAPGDIVRSFDETTKLVVSRHVVRTFKRKTSCVVRLSLDDGRNVVCTPNHPILTDGGWIIAGEITGGCLVRVDPMRGMWGNDAVPVKIDVGQVEVWRSSLLLEGMQLGLSGPHLVGDYGEDQPRSRIGQDDRTQPDAQRRNSPEGEQHPPTHRSQALGAGRERSRNVGATEAFAVGAWRWVDRRGCRDDGREEGERDCSSLQDRYRAPEQNDSDRGGRREPLLESRQGKGQEKRGFLDVARVVRVEVHEQGGDGEFERLCSNGDVYNFEVEGTHTYFANGIAVHNCHHVGADGYKRIIDKLKENNPSIKLFGVTATPNRGDKKALKPTFDNVGDQITLQEMIKSGHLVRPRTFVKDVGISEELKKVKKTVDDFDMNAVADIMNKPVINDKVVEEWQGLAANRRTVVFCSTIQHATDVMLAFKAAGVSCDMITGDLPKHERRSILKAYANGEIRVLVNVAVLTEGWDDPPTSCVILLRPSSYKSTYLQMVGRGLRIVTPDEHPGISKIDCIILDFGRSTLAHGSLEQTPDLAQEMACPSCGFVHPKAVNPCPSCGFDRAPDMGETEEEATESEEADEEEEIATSNFVMTEIDLIARSAWRWIDPWDNGDALMASGFEAWVGIFWLGGTWYAIGGQSPKDGGRRAVKYLGSGERIVALAIAEDFLNDHETDGSSAHKSKRWLKDPASDKQLALIGERPGAMISKYQAVCLINFKFNRGRILYLIQSANAQSSMAA